MPDALTDPPPHVKKEESRRVREESSFRTFARYLGLLPYPLKERRELHSTAPFQEEFPPFLQCYLASANY